MHNLIGKTLLILNLFIFVLFVKAQNENHSDSTFFYKGDSLVQQGSYPQALKLFNGIIDSKSENDLWRLKALNKVAFINTQLGNNKTSIDQANIVLSKAQSIHGEIKNLEIDAYGVLAIAYRSLGKYDSAVLYQSKNKEIVESTYGDNGVEIAGSYKGLGVIYDLKGDYTEALKYLNKALDIQEQKLGQEHLTTAGTYYSIAIVYYYSHQLDSSEYYLNKSLAIRRSQLGNKSLKVAEALNIWGSINLQKSFYNKAKECFEEILEILLGLVSAKNPRVATAYSNLGNVHTRLYEYDKAIEYKKKAIALNSEILPPKHNKLGIDFYNLGLTYRRLNLNDSAITYFNRAVDVFSYNNSPFLSNAYLALGIENRIKADFDESKKFLNKALKLGKEKYGKYHKVIAQVYQQLGWLHQEHQRYEEGLVYVQEGLSSISVDFDNENIYANPNSDQSLDRKVSLDILRCKAQILYDLAKKNKDDNFKVKALKTVFLCDTLIDQTRQESLLGSDKVIASAENVFAYEMGISICKDLSTSKGDKEYIDTAFYFLEKGKAANLRESFSIKEHVSLLPPKLVALQSELHNRQVKLRNDLLRVKRSDENNEQLKELQYNLFEVNRSYDSLKNVFRRDFRKYYNITHSNEVIPLSEVQSKLPNESIVIEYFLGENNDFVFKIQKDQIQLDILDKNTFKYLEKQTYSRSNNQQQLSDFTKMLQKSVGDSITHLIIIPDSALWNVNFDLLLTEEPQSDNPRELPYLFKKYAISYAYSASLLFREESEKNKTNQSLLAFSFGDEDDSNAGQQVALRTLRASDEDLPGSRREVKAISELVDGDYYFGKYASEKLFKETAGDYQVLHLAIHGQVDDKESENSKLNFYAEGDSIEDGQLHVFEIYNMDLSADLAVLSACETGDRRNCKG